MIFQADTGKQKRRIWKNSIFAVLCLLVASLAVVILITLLSTIVYRGGSGLSGDFLQGHHRDEKPDESGMGPAIIGSIYICTICAMLAVPIGIGTAIFLEEFKPRNRVLIWFHGLIQLNISNLAGVPSIVYGILGLTAFVYMFGVFGNVEANKPSELEFGARRYYQVRTVAKEYLWIPANGRTETTLTISNEAEIDARFADGENVTLNVITRGDPLPNDDELKSRTVYDGQKGSIIDKHPFYFIRLPFHKGVLSAGLTLALVILPIIIISSQESIRAVPGSLREAAFGMGCTQWQMVRTVTLPAALPGIMTGVILSMGRAVGEAAPLLAVMGGMISKRTGPNNLMDDCTAMPILIYKWAQDDNPGFWNISASAIIVLLVFLLLMNSVAIVIRYLMEKKYA